MVEFQKLCGIIRCSSCHAQSAEVSSTWSDGPETAKLITIYTQKPGLLHSHMLVSVTEVQKPCDCM